MTSIDYAKYRALIREPDLNDQQKDELITQLHTILVTLVDRILVSGAVDNSVKKDSALGAAALSSKPYSLKMKANPTDKEDQP